MEEGEIFYSYVCLKDINHKFDVTNEGILDPIGNLCKFCELKDTKVCTTKTFALVANIDGKIITWHERLGHLNNRSM